MTHPPLEAMTPQDQDIEKLRKITALGEQLVKQFALVEGSKKIADKTTEQWDEQDAEMQKQFMLHQAWLKATDAENLVPLLKSATLSQWRYCPECGSEKTYNHNGDQRWCENCGQDWYTSVNYTSAVQENLARLRPTVSPVMADRREVLEEATVKRVAEAIQKDNDISPELAWDAAIAAIRALNPSKPE